MGGEHVKKQYLGNMGQIVRPVVHYYFHFRDIWYTLYVLTDGIMPRVWQEIEYDGSMHGHYSH